MGAENSVQRDGKSQEEDASASASASAGELSAEVNTLQEGSSVLDSKPLEKNGLISSMTSLNGHSEDNTLAEVGQPDGVAQKEETPESMDTIQGEVAPQVNGEKVEKESPDANDISAVEEKAAEEKPEDASEVGFKKIFRFVGFKFTLKKDKSEEKDPVKLLTVKDKEEGEEVGVTDEPTKEEEAATAEEKSSTEEKEADTEASTAEADKAETTDAPAEDTAAEATDEGVEKEGETTLSPFRKLFSGGLFSNLRKKASIRKTKEEEDKEAAVEEDTAKTEDAAAAAEEKEEKDDVDQETKEEAPTTPEEVKSESTPESEVTDETPAAATTDETKPGEEKAEPSAEEEKAPAEVTTEAELLSSQEKAKPQGSPLKKLFTGAGLKKLSTKKQKAKKDNEAKLTESGEQAAEQLQSSTESAENPKADSGPSSPEESGEHVIAVEVTQNESSQETDGEVASDGEKKKEGIIAWSSFKKLVTPKKRVKRSSESEDEATGEKPAKSATLSSSESAPLADKSVEEEAKEDKPTEEEPKTENSEKLVSSTEEPKKKMDTSVSWEALMCMGGPKKRTRKTSDSDDEETKVEEESTAAALEGEQVGKTEAAIVSSQNTDSDGEVVSSPEPLSPPPERESTWDTLKRMVMPKNKAKVEEKPEETTEQVQSDSEAPKDESSFSLRKLFPGRKKKKAEKQASTEQGEEDSDTPAVVPLSDYEDQVKAEQKAPEEPAEVQIKVSTEDRSPSWIPAPVEDGDDQHDQLSDIPEEAENAATPKSVETDIAEDEAEDKDNLSLEVPKCTGRRLSLAEVKPVAQAPSAETTPVLQRPEPESAQEVMEGIQAEISEIPPQTNVTVEDVPVEVVSDKTEYEPPTENAESKTHAILEPHARDEAMAICTGLGTKEIAKVVLEKPVMPIVESLAVIRDVVITQTSVEEKSAITEEAIITETAMFNAEVHQVDTTELEPVVESSQGELTAIQAGSESHEPEIEMVGIVSTVQEESEIIQPTTMSENSPKDVMRGDPITPTLETAVCTQSVEVTEPSVETKEVKMDVEQLAAIEQNTVKEVVESVTAEIVSTIGEITKTTITKETEPTIPGAVPSDGVVISETVVLVAPVSVAASDMIAMESTPEAVGDDSIQVQETKEEGEVEETVEATTAQTAASEISAVTEQSSKDMEEIQVDVQQTSEIEAQSIVIAQAVIQDAMDKVSEDASESKKLTTPTPVQAVATIEEEIEITPVISDTPVAVVCEQQASKSPQLLHVAMEVIDPIQVEVTESLDASVEEKKSAEGLLKAVEVKVSEEIVVEEEVVEIKAESQTGEELEEVKEEQSKEDAEVQEPDVEEAAEEVEPQSEGSKSEAPSEQNKEKVLEIHMPLQVVLQTAQVFEEPSVEEEAAEEFDCNGSVAEDTDINAKRVSTESKLSTLSEEPQATAEVSAPSQVSEAETPETPSGKCAEVMAQVIEVIEEAVKEIEPVSTEITAAS
ncbi:A-kinase anchor protein 12b isoform X1 [Anarrhichthys ocellatus]|uniref:A-kinase anchor protein 12b isoform X1 n=1 Tax=Anarrhichthys ocellatus TaxID=433405 RepID=UPI0012ECF88B|nr:A-kinase anchor protein 12-like isoform X1 [Anarrhichthys ocellatus]